MRRCAAACVLFLAAWRISLADMAQLIEDEWMLIKIAGQPVGYAHSEVKLEGDILHSSVKTVLRLERMGVTLEQEVLQEFRETKSGTPISFWQLTRGAGQDIEVAGNFRGRTLELASRTMGAERRRTERLPPDVLFGRALEDFVRRNMRGPGKSFSFRTYSVELDKLVEVTYEVVGWEEVQTPAGRARTVKALVRGLYPGMVPIEYRDEQGIVWKLEMGLLGLSMEMVRASREQALAGLRGGGRNAFDLLLDIAVRSPVKFPRPRELSYARYRLIYRGGNIRELLLEGPGQKVLGFEDDSSAIIEVRRVVPNERNVLPRPIRKPELSQYLQPSTYVQSDDPEIVRVASELAAKGTSSLEVARELERWVFWNVRSKGFDRGFATAKEVMAERAGDCTEHSVLLCALLRASGIPARVVSGLVYIELQPDRPVFAYHMWTEAYVGEWLPLDGTLAGPFVDATHIRLAESDLAGMSPAAGIVEMLQVFGQLELQVLDFSVDDASGLGRTRLRRPGWGFSFEAGPDWEPMKPEASALCQLRRRQTGETLVVATGEAPPGGRPSEIAESLKTFAELHRQEDVLLGGLPAARFRYVRHGREREAVAASRGGKLYVIRIEPPSEPARAALDLAVETFVFE